LHAFNTLLLRCGRSGGIGLSFGNFFASHVLFTQCNPNAAVIS
jgi:hypothetical protein